MEWHVSHRADPRARELADRHYSRQSHGHPQFVPPGRCIVLLTRNADALWVTSWPFAQYVKHEWAGAWTCSLFRNQGPCLSSELIIQAVACTRHVWPSVPDLGFITFVDQSKVRRKRDPGRCFIRAGFHHVGQTQGGLLAFQLLAHEMPEALEPGPWLETPGQRTLFSP